MSAVADGVLTRGWFRALASLAVFAIALAALHHLTREFHLQDALAAAGAVSPEALLAAALATAGSYAVLGLYDILALRHIAHPLPWWRAAVTSFIAYAVGHNAGLVAFSAGAIRYRLYSLAGLDAAEIAQVAAFCSLTFLLGAGLLTGISLIGDAGAAASALHASAPVAVALGSTMLLAFAAWLAITGLRQGPVTMGGWRLALPTLPMTLAQTAVAAADLVLAGAALYFLLPAEAPISFTAFLGLYMIAMVAGAISTVPGGLGVFESVLLILLPGIPAQALLGALLLYRALYYVAPFSLAVVLLAGNEVHRKNSWMRQAAGWTRRSLDFVVPQGMAVLAFGAGLVLLLSGATPAAAGRIEALQRFLPLPLLEISHLAASIIGVGLLILARGLYYRLDAAWHLMLWLLGAGITVSFLKGLDWEEALLLALMVVPLVLSRREFYRPASLFAEPLAPRWLATVAMAVGASVWVGVFAHRAVPYRNELWWQFAFDASAPRMLRASLVAAIGVGALAAIRLLRPRRPAAEPPSAHDLVRARDIVRTADSVTGHLALLGDKSLLFSQSGRSFIMYGVSGRSWIAMGDPVGQPAERQELVWRFRELCDQAAGLCAFYEVGAANLPLYVDAGLSLVKIGEEGRVPLAGFSLEGSARAGLRQSCHRAAREGASFRVVEAHDVGPLLPRLRAISDEWLAARAAGEKGFSLGYFDAAYLSQCPCAVVERAGRVVAFANLWTGDSRHEFSIDLMRYAADAPKSVMDFLFVQLMLWGRAQGYGWFSLGMAPLSGLEEHRLAPAWHKVGRLVYRYGENFYNFEGLRHYKEKFLPEWQPRYLAVPSGAALPRVLLDVTALISGGLGRTVGGRPREPS